MQVNCAKSKDYDLWYQIISNKISSDIPQFAIKLCEIDSSQTVTTLVPYHGKLGQYNYASFYRKEVQCTVYNCHPCKIIK